MSSEMEVLKTATVGLWSLEWALYFFLYRKMKSKSRSCWTGLFVLGLPVFVGLGAWWLSRSFILGGFFALPIAIPLVDVALCLYREPGH